MTMQPIEGSRTVGFGLDFVPQLRSDIGRRDLDGESVVWSSLATDPIALDPVATVMLDVVDGDASIGDLAADVHDAIGVPLDTAQRQVAKVIELFSSAGLLATSSPEPQGVEEIQPRDLFASGPTPCSENASRLGTVTFHLRFGDQTIRIACDSRRGARKLRAALDGHIVNETDEVPLGFVLTAPQGLHRDHRLTDRSGFVLSEARGLESGLHALACHLTAFLPPAPGTVRVRARMVAAGDRAVVCLFPLLFFPTVQEADLERAGLSVVDRLAVDLDVRTGRLTNPEVPWPALADLRAAPGHAGTGGSVSAVAVVDAAGPYEAEEPTRASVAAALARNRLAGSMADILDTASALSSNVERRAAQPGSHDFVSVLQELARRP